MSVVQRIAQAVIAGDEIHLPELVQQALATGTTPRDVLHAGLLPGMTEVGRRFRDGEFYLPEVLVAAEAMKAAMTTLKPHLVQAGVQPDATAVIGTVRGDLHDIGKNLVAIMLEGAGFEVIDLGVDVSAEAFVRACRRPRVQVVAMSALLTTTMPMLAEITHRLKAELNPTPAILIGGAPVTQDYADQIGADGYGRDAASGAELAKRLCQMGT